MKRANKRLAALLTALALLLTCGVGTTVFATEGEADSGPPVGASGTITAVATPTDITMPLGTSREALALPDALDATATVEGEDGSEEQLVSVPVESWACEDYNPDTADTYEFVPTPGALPCPLAEGVTLPALAVTLEEQPDGVPATPTQVTVAALDALAEDVLWQGFDAGTKTLADLTLPDTLTGKDDSGAPLTIEGVTWPCTAAGSIAGEPFENTAFDPNTEGKYAFTAKLTEGYTLAEGAALPEISVIVRPAGGVGISTLSLNDDLTVGTWTSNRRYVEFGGRLWRVLEVTVSDGTDGNAIGKKTAFLLAEDFVSTREFHTGANNDWNNSDIKAWLNSEGNHNGASDGFLNGTFSDNEKAAILTTNYIYGGTYTGNDTTGSSKVFLLSVDEVNTYLPNSDDRAMGAGWWLRSPGNNLLHAAVVDAAGSVNPYGGNVLNPYGIRPALKVNLASDIFTSSEILYGAQITVSGGSGPISGARLTLSGASAPDAKFSNSSGVATFPGSLSGGQYILTVEKAGYEKHTSTITIGEGSTDHTVPLTADDSLPETVYFGQESNSPLAWRVLTIENGTALLLTDDVVGGSGDTWSNINSWINDTSPTGFLDSGNFTAAERAAMNGSVFLLSKDEAERYLPDNSLRRLTNFWWLGSMDGSDYDFVSNGGDIGSAAGTFNYYARPAVWVDLSKLCLSVSSGTTTLVPAYAATVNVEDAGGNAINGANVTLTLASGQTYRNPDGTALTLTGTTASGSGAAFTLPVGTYTIAVTGASGYEGRSGTLTISADGMVSGNTITLTANTPPTKKSGDLTQTVAQGGTATFNASTIATDTDTGDTLTITAIATHPASGTATAALGSGTVTLTGVAAGTTSVTVKVSDGANTANITVPITVTAQPTITVSFDAQGGSPAPGSITVPVGGTYPALPGVSRADYSFNGWYTAASGGSRVQQGDALAFSTDHTLYAQWTYTGGGNPPQPTTYTVTYRASDASGGTVPVDGNAYRSGSVVTVQGNPGGLWRSGYDFIGWNDSQGHIYKENDTFSITGNTLLSAAWRKHSDNSGSTSDSSSGSDKPEPSAPKAKLPASAFRWDGERTLTIDHDGLTVLGLMKLYWDGVETTAYTVRSGSVIITFSHDFIAAQEYGTHTVRVEFLNHYGEYTVTLAAPEPATEAGNDTHNPETGGYPDNPQTGDSNPFLWLWVLVPALLVAGLVGYRIIRRRRSAGEH